MSASVHLFRCGSCKVTYSVLSKDPHRHLLKNGVPCPNYPCEGTVKALAKTNARMKAVSVRALELYQAHILGLQHERFCSPERLIKFMTGAKIEKVDVEVHPDRNKAILHSITLEGGKTVHLGPSTHGALALKLTENKSVR